MSPRPLHRSMTFWAGILVMGFICWAWWDSMRYESAVYRGAPMASNVAAFVGMGRFTDPFSAGVPEVELQRKPLDRMEGKLTTRGKMTTPLFPLPLFAVGEAGEDDPTSAIGDLPEIFTYARFVKEVMPTYQRGDWILLIPHWLVLLAVALPWGGEMVWRRRRMRRGVVVE